MTHLEVGRAATAAMSRQLTQNRIAGAVEVVDAPLWRSNPVSEVARHEVRKELGRGGIVHHSIVAPLESACRDECMKTSRMDHAMGQS